MVRLLVSTSWLLLSGCTILSQPPKLFDEDPVRDGDGVAYLWSAAKVKQPALSMQDFAVVMQIDDAVITSRYRPSAGMGPGVAWRIEIPVGTHTVEILNKETLVCGPLYGIGGCTVVDKSSHRVEFTAEPGRTYVPIVDQTCGRKWFWIADSGPSSPADGDKVSPLPFSDHGPVVGGEAPPAGSCQSSDVDAAERE
jgi:hypothetical protein